MNREKENYIKNILATALAVVVYPFLKSALSVINTDSLGDFLLVISILLVTVSFANFAFTYESADLRSFSGRFLSHATTFIFIFLTAISLEAMVIAFGVAYPSLYSFITSFSILLYLGIVLYDMWDFKRFSGRH